MKRNLFREALSDFIPKLKSKSEDYEEPAELVSQSTLFLVLTGIFLAAAILTALLVSRLFAIIPLIAAAPCALRGGILTFVIKAGAWKKIEGVCEDIQKPLLLLRPLRRGVDVLVADEDDGEYWLIHGPSGNRSLHAGAKIMAYVSESFFLQNGVKAPSSIYYLRVVGRPVEEEDEDE